MIEAVVTKNTVPDLAERMQGWKRMVQGPLLKDVAKLTTRQARDRIKTTHHSPDLKPWAPRKHEYPHPILRKSGRLLRSLRAKRTSSKEYSSGVQASFASKVALYAMYQQHGTRRGLEARPFVGVGFNDADEIETLIETFVELRF